MTDRYLPQDQRPRSYYVPQLSTRAPHKYDSIDREDAGHATGSLWLFKTFSLVSVGANFQALSCGETPEGVVVSIDTRDVWVSNLG